MLNELCVVDEREISQDSKRELTKIVNQLVEKSSNEEIAEYTLQCTNYMNTIDYNLSKLKNRSLIKRIKEIAGGEITNTILADQKEAIYLTQSMINRVRQECYENRKLMSVVNGELNDVYLQLKESQNTTNKNISKLREFIVSFYDDFEKQKDRIDRIEQIAKISCPQCGNKMPSWAIVCANCGSIHPIKEYDVNDKTVNKLDELSTIVQDETLNTDILWDATAQKIESVARKINKIAQFGSIKYPEDLINDMDELVKRCKVAEFHIAIIGVVKAGKSFLMNALVGQEIASVQCNPETAALTKFRSANGYYVDVTFHSEEEWENLKISAAESKDKSDSSLYERLKMPEIKEESEKWVGRKDIRISCRDIEELRDVVKKYTSTQETLHLFVSEVEVGIDASVFDMPKEVVFVDTPGLKDPVKYRSDITKKYIKRANAVLIAVRMDALSNEGMEVISKVLDYTDKDKAYIVATQKDIKAMHECESIVSQWAERLVEAKKYTDVVDAKSRMIATSSKMYLLINKWVKLSDKEEKDTTVFSDADYSDLRCYAEKVLKTREYTLSDLRRKVEDENAIVSETGIDVLKAKLKDELIDNHKSMLIEQIKNLYTRCKKTICEHNNNIIEREFDYIESTEQSKKELREKIKKYRGEQDRLEADNFELKTKADELRNDIKSMIEAL